ncbi:hypothetical protein LEP1GSC203_3335 [Leptospira terpstrae serovar Hualin str. LT 11-33 = ATCC 700639]|uniref:Uncharacterized protein n=1 Tax=Leptospira terpstrae serovar Hualin str. LT 11-33 = ATCC 700639 TaxID=1257025 RepID=N1W1K1_9LEPT|nr:hypothetical protein LEP1GSC203_3335 [Leptospira terpstrae serovar Hualin str. LT 11-33 = ATCC 700639]
MVFGQVWHSDGSGKGEVGLFIFPPRNYVSSLTVFFHFLNFSHSGSFADPIDNRENKLHEID